MSVQTPYEVHVQTTETCPACHHDLSAVLLDHLIRRQVLDLPLLVWE